MIKKLKISLLIIVLTLFVGVGSVYAADITYSVDTTVDLSDPNINLTILATSVATSTVVGTGTVVVTVPVSSTFTISSADRLLNATGETQFGVISKTCTSPTLSTMTITAPAGAAQTITITPAGSACTLISGGGAPPGGGGGNPPADTTAPTGTSININSGEATTSSLSTTLTLAAVDATQMIISNDAGFAGASWESYVTSKSWMLISGDGVKTVYAKFRDAAGNMSSATSDSITVSGSGTEEVIPTLPVPTQGCSGGNLYNTSTGALCVNNAGPEIPGCGNRTTGFSTANGQSCVGNRTTTGTNYNFGTRTLKNGSKGEAVMELQRFLNQVLNLGLVVDGKLGPKTIKVIKQWQKDNGLVADGLVGAKTKAKMNASVQ